MYILIAGWGYVALMMAIAEATSPQGTVLGAIVTFVLYGAAPLAIATYIFGTPARKRRLRAKADEAARQASTTPDARGEAPADAVAPVRKED